MAALVFGRGFEPTDEVAFQAWLDASGVPEDDARALREQGAERLLVYRRLVRGTLREAVECAIPRTMARLGLVFDEYFDRYLREHAPRSRYLRDVTTELLDFCEPLWARDERVPAWAMDLARHEAVQIVVASELARSPGHEPGELSLDRPVAFVEAARLMRYAHAVHQLSEDPDDLAEPSARPTALFVYRSPEHEVRYLALSSLCADILAHLLAGEPLGSAIQRASAEAAQALDQSVIDGVTEVLADLAARGALLGARAAEEAA
jgi:hypothetical protein